jgi:hypothetical protein
MITWHFRLQAGGVETAYYIVSGDREQALYQAQQALTEELKAEGIRCLTARVTFEERFEI